MDISAFLLTNVLNGLIGILLLVGGYKIFDWLTPKWKFHEIFGNSYLSNGGLVVSAFLLSLALVIAFTAG